MRASGAELKRHTIIVALVILVTVSVPTILALTSGGGGLAADRLKRILELEARAALLSEQLAQKDSQRESQRAIYIERIRKGDAQVREQALEILALRRRSEVTAAALELRPTSSD
jgi:hypothetical protein